MNLKTSVAFNNPSITLEQLPSSCDLFGGFDPVKIVLSSALLRDCMHFIEATDNPLEKIQKFMDDVGFQESKDRIYVDDTDCVYVRYEKYTKEHRGAFSLAVFNKNDELLFACRFLRRPDGTWDIHNNPDWYRPALQKLFKKREITTQRGAAEFVESFKRGIQALIVFMEFVQLEERVVKHNSKYRTNYGPDIKNKTGKDFIVADIGWNRDIIRDAPFSVRGHWRMQRVGAGRTKVKLTWVKGHTRSGYKREARNKHE